MPTEIKIMAYTCVKCGETIYSRAGHDYNICSCGHTAIDGGPKFIDYDMDFGYQRIKGEPLPTTTILTDFYNVEEAKVALYRDWNESINKYGKVSG